MTESARGPRAGTPAPAGAGLDWVEARRRLARTGEAIEGSRRLAPERARQVLDERARALARPAAAAVRPGLQIVRLSLGTETYALETRNVLRIARMTEFTPVPGAPDFVVGVINLAGEVLAVVDLRRLLGVAQVGLTDLARVVVLGRERAEFGILADAVHEISALPAEEILEPPGSVAGIGRSHLRGVTAGALIVLNGDALLDDARLFIEQRSESGA